MKRPLLTATCAWVVLVTAPGLLWADGKKVTVTIDNLKYRPATV